MCEKLREHFDGAKAVEIYAYLMMHGMYYPFTKGKALVKTLKQNNVWETIKEEQQLLQKEWEGPDIPVFIFPLDITNRTLMYESNGKSGLAFSDKLFLFVSGEMTEKEIRALFTHEYNHVVRLSAFLKKEADYVLLDTIVLEGLAEHAVFERFGTDYNAAWTSYYTDERLHEIWNHFVYPNRNIPKVEERHQAVLYGKGIYPKKAGYASGYDLVKQFAEMHHFTNKELLQMKTEYIARDALK